jgi:hypothetical protein
MIYWDTDDHPCQFNDEVKKIYDNEIKNNRKQFTSWIGKISEKFYKYNLDWHISTPASRNPFVSKLYHNICTTKTFIKLIKKKVSFRITVYTKKHFNLLNDLKKKNDKVEIIYKEQNIKFLFIKNFLKSLILQSIILFFVKIFIKKNKISKNLVLIDYFHIQNNFYNNRYYNEVSSKKFLSNKNIFFVPTFVSGKGFIRTLINIFKLRHNKKILFKEHFLSFRDLICSYLYFKNLNFFNKKYLKYSKIDFSNLMYEEIKNNFEINTIILSKLNYYFIKNLYIKDISVKKSINWFENQQADKAWNFAFRKYFKKTLVLGYQGFTLYPQYMCTHPSQNEEKCKTIPEKIIVIGKAYVQSRKEFFKTAKILVGPALTFQKIFDTKNSKKKSKNVLLILTGISEIDKVLINWCIKVAESLKKIKIILKPHPILPIDNKISHDFPKNVHINNSNLFKIYPKVRVVISCGPTSATIESLAYGLELIIPILDVNDELILDILSGKKKNIVLVKNEKSLIIQLKKTLEKKTNKNRDKRKDTLIKNYFFNKSSKKNMRLFC